MNATFYRGRASDVDVLTDWLATFGTNDCSMSMPEIRTIDVMTDDSGHLLFCVFIMEQSKIMFPYDCVGQLGDEWIIRLSESPTWELITVSDHAFAMQAGSVYLVRAENAKSAIAKIPMDDKLGNEWF